ncbi:hypothetical protein GUJ93_ZPchr0006g46071 [Zizania palustris]|uniref:Uncharacterized protein n=1 Tax=Zizania palustris TaxID=103762 RepID=A0A8J5SCZ1_ZIZPA|nr:hypothetical protein GUJ93_ZPchr0006g46071 [Zizania palustris]
MALTMGTGQDVLEQRGRGRHNNLVIPSHQAIHDAPLVIMRSLLDFLLQFDYGGILSQIIKKGKTWGR